jgi:molecular chaperone GrpE|tara:strand:- start:3890 stop:4414 length:525 start_codon:yes stop_codon:yes gene_type:complete
VSKSKEKITKKTSNTKRSKNTSKPKRKDANKDANKQLNELQDKHLRLKAEFENFRRRKADEVSKLLQFEGENVIKGFLPILDDLERMVGSTNSSDESLSEGIELVKNKISKFFEGMNVEPFGQKGDEMDPVIHDAMLTQANEDEENDVILEVFEKGYTYRDKVIRHAKVIVNKK